MHLWQKAEQRRRQGVKIVVIDPHRNRTARGADRHIPIKVGTDAALAIGIVNILVRDGKHDEAYLAANTLGFDQWRREVVSRFPPERVAEITGLSVDDVERLAGMYGATKKSFLRIGWGMTRLARGGQAMRAVATLPAVTGAYGVRGGGAMSVTAPSLEFNFASVRTPSGPAQAREVNHSLLGEALLSLDDPPLKALFVSSNNPAVTCPDTRKVKAGPVARGPFHRRARSHADRHGEIRRYRAAGDDISRNLRFLSRLWQLLHAVRAGRRAPSGRGVVQYAARPGARASHGGRGPDLPPDPGRDPAEFFDGAKGAVAKVDPKRLLDHRAVKAAPEGVGQEFRTKSGKLEIYSAELAAQGVAPMPIWEPDPQEEMDTAEWPLRLLTTPGYFQSHTAFSANAFLRKREGDPCCVLHPSDAARRGLKGGERVRLFNERGEVGLVLRSARRYARASCWSPASGPKRRPSSAPSTICAPLD